MDCCVLPKGHDGNHMPGMADSFLARAAGEVRQVGLGPGNVRELFWQGATTVGGVEVIVGSNSNDALAFWSLIESLVDEMRAQDSASKAVPTAQQADPDYLAAKAERETVEVES